MSVPEILSRSQFEKLPQEKQAAHLASLSQPGIRLAYKKGTGLHVLADTVFKPGDIVCEDSSLAVRLFLKNLAHFCCSCGMDFKPVRNAPDDASMTFVFKDMDGEQHQMRACRVCLKSQGTRDAIRWCQALGKECTGDFSTLVLTMHAIQTLKRWPQRRVDFARAALLTHR